MLAGDSGWKCGKSIDPSSCAALRAAEQFGENNAVCDPKQRVSQVVEGGETFGLDVERFCQMECMPLVAAAGGNCRRLTYEERQKGETEGGNGRDFPRVLPENVYVDPTTTTVAPTTTTEAPPRGVVERLKDRLKDAAAAAGSKL